MAIKIKFDNAYNVIEPTLVLATRSGKKIGYIPAVNISVSDNLNSASEIEFKVNKYNNGEEYEYWDKLVDFKLVWCREWDIWFEIAVTINEEDSLTKEIQGTSLPEAELSQINLYNIEINTEDDIARDDYEVTVLYNESNTDGSLLHRITEKIPHYTIEYVESRIASIQRTFTFDDISIYDAFQEIAEEIDCIFVFDAGSNTDGTPARTIRVYDLESYCYDCGTRNSVNSEYCSKCGGTNLIDGYGEDTTIFVSRENLADSITFDTDTDSVKNCFRLEAGDDLMTATIINCNPNGSQYLWYFSDDTKEDMSDELVAKLDEYDELYDYYYNDYEISIDGDILTAYNELVEKYQSYNSDLTTLDATIVGYPDLMTAYYDTIDFYLYLEDTMMPSVDTASTDAETEAAKLTSDELSPVAVSNIDTCSGSTASSAVLAMAKTIVNGNFQVKVGDYSYDSNTHIWTGYFTVINYSDDEDTATSDTIEVEVNDDEETYILQRIDKILAEADEDDEGTDISSLFAMDITYVIDDDDEITSISGAFVEKIKEYCLVSLNTFHDSCQSCLDILIEQGVADNETWADQDPNLYEELYEPWYVKLIALEEEILVREAEIEIITGVYDTDGNLEEDGMQTIIDDEKLAIQEILDMEDFIGEDLMIELMSYRREDTYSNSNYISDGLSNAELFANALEFIEVANNEIYKSATLQHSISASLQNLLVMPEFEPLVDYFEVGNWIRVRIGNSNTPYIDNENAAYVDEAQVDVNEVSNYRYQPNDIYKLRLISYTIDFDDLTNIQVEFSDVKEYATGVSDTQSILNQASSMASSYSSVSRQASQGSSGKAVIDDWNTVGLDLTNTKIISAADDQSQVLDSHGILLRQYNSITGDYEDEQMKIVNSTLAITDDNWRTIRTAIGRFYYVDPSTGVLTSAYGINGEVLVGSLILGESLAIYAANGALIFDENGLTIDTSNTDGSVFTITNGDNVQFYIDGDGNVVLDNGATITWGNIDLTDLFLNLLSSTYSTDEDGNITTVSEYLATQYATIEYLTAYSIDSVYGVFENLTAYTLDAENFTAENATIDEAYIEKLKALLADIDTLIANSATIENLSATYATIEYLNAGYLEVVTAQIQSLFADLANIDTLEADEAYIESLQTTIANIDELIASSATITTLEAEIADINSLFADYATIEYLTTNYLNANYITTNYLDATTIQSTYATITDLEAVTADITSLNADIATITTLLAGGVATDELTAIHLTSENVVIDDAVITDAMIASLSASKITSGSIYTSLVTIQTAEDDTTLYIDNSLLQIADEDSNIRIQLGLDGEGNYNYYVFDADGNILFDALGIYGEGIHEGVIINDHVASKSSTYTGISGDKLDIDSVITSINEDGSVTIEGTSVTIDGETLDYKLTEITQSVGGSLSDYIVYYALSTSSTEAPDLYDTTPSLVDTAIVDESTADGTDLSSVWSTTYTAPTDDSYYVWRVYVLESSDGTLTVGEPALITGDSIAREKTETLTTELSVVQGQIEALVAFTAIDDWYDGTTTIYDMYSSLTVELESITSTVSSLEITVNGSDEITGLVSKVSTLEQTATEISASVVSLEENIETITSEIGDKETESTILYNITQLQISLNDILLSIEELEEESTSDYKTLVDKIASLELTVDSIDLSVSSLESYVESGLSTVWEEIASLTLTSDSIIASVSSVTSQVENSLVDYVAYYALSTSSTEAPDLFTITPALADTAIVDESLANGSDLSSNWSTSYPTIQDGYYIWQVYVYTTASGNVTYGEPSLITGDAIARAQTSEVSSKLEIAQEYIDLLVEYTELTSWQNDSTTIYEAFSNLNVSLEEISATVSSLTVIVSGDDDTVGLVSKVATITETVDGIDATVESLVETVGDESSGLVYEVANISASIDEINLSITSYRTEIDGITSDITDITSDISSLDDAINGDTGITYQISQINLSIDDILLSVESLETTVGDTTTGLVYQVAQLELSLDQISLSVSNLSALEEEISSLSITSDGIVASVASIENIINDTLTNYQTYYALSTSSTEAPDFYSTTPALADTAIVGESMADYTELSSDWSITYPTISYDDEEEYYVWRVYVLESADGTLTIGEAALITGDAVARASTETLTTELSVVQGQIEALVAFTAIEDWYDGTTTIYDMYSSITVELESITSTVSSLETTVNGSDEITGLVSKVSTLEQTSSEISASVSSLEESVDSINSEIGDEDTESTIIYDIAQLKVSVSEILFSIESLDVVSTSDYEELVSQVSSLSITVDSIDMSVSSLDSYVTSGFSSIEEQIAALTLTSDSIIASVSSVTSQIENSLTDYVVYYALSESSETAPDLFTITPALVDTAIVDESTADGTDLSTNWSISYPAIQDGYYIWQVYVYTATSGVVTYGEPSLITGDAIARAKTSEISSTLEVAQEYIDLLVEYTELTSWQNDSTTIYEAFSNLNVSLESITSTVNNLTTIVNGDDDTVGLVSQVATLTETAESIDARVESLEVTVGDDETGLVADVAALTITANSIQSSVSTLTTDYSTLSASVTTVTQTAESLTISVESLESITDSLALSDSSIKLSAILTVIEQQSTTNSALFSTTLNDYTVISSQISDSSGENIDDILAVLYDEYYELEDLYYKIYGTDEELEDLDYQIYCAYSSTVVDTEEGFAELTWSTTTEDELLLYAHFVDYAIADTTELRDEGDSDYYVYYYLEITQDDGTVTQTVYAQYTGTVEYTCYYDLLYNAILNAMNATDEDTLNDLLVEYEDAWSNYMTYEALLESYFSILQTDLLSYSSSNSLTISENSVQAYADDLVEEYADALEALQTQFDSYFIFDNNGLTIGATTSSDEDEYKMVLRNNGLYLECNNEVTAYIASNNETSYLYIVNACVENSLMVGGFSFVPRFNYTLVDSAVVDTDVVGSTNGGMSIIWTES